MRILFYTLSLAFVFMGILFSCKKDAGNKAPDPAPENLNIACTISSNGSGSVEFTAHADNAINYHFELGNGGIMSSQDGNLSYSYPEEGTKTYTVLVTAVGSGGQTIKKSIEITVTRTFSLFWSEEFDIDGSPDPTTWGYDIGGGGWGNNELEYYTNRTENVIVKDGTLKINLIKEAYSGAAYTSARILSKDKFAFTYGKVVARAKLPAGKGTWPAIWMLGSNISSAPWPACGEIDIMEHVGNSQDLIYGTLHYPGHSGGSANGNSVLINGASNAFHEYTIEWSPVALKFYVDNVLFHRVENSSMLPFNHDFFLILNIAMGGNFGGAVDPSFSTASLEVDYIRVFQ